MELAVLCAAFGLPEPESAEELPGGTAARVYRLRCGAETFLLRTLRDREQGEKEAAICRGVQEHGFPYVPEIILSADGMPFAAQNGQLFQLQRYVPGRRPTCDDPAEVRQIARTICRLREALSHCPAIASHDRFALEEIWPKARNGWGALGTGISLAEAEREVAACLAFPEGERQVIHGDLGPWNLLQAEDGALYVIDFGDARMGDAYFDLAAALGGLINHAPEGAREAVVTSFLEELKADRERLRQQLRLWGWRGLAQCAAAALEGSGFTRFAPRFLHAMEQGERWIGGRA